MISMRSCINATGHFFQKLSGKSQAAELNAGCGYASKYDLTEGVTWAKVQKEYFARKSGSETVELDFNKAA